MVFYIYYVLLLYDVIHCRLSVVGIESKTCLINALRMADFCFTYLLAPFKELTNSYL